MPADGRLASAIDPRDGLPDICGAEEAVAAVRRGPRTPVAPAAGGIRFETVRSCAAVALHMHQPLVTAGGDDLERAAIVSNLEDMLAHPEVGDNHDAPVFLHCYARPGQLVPDLLCEGKAPRLLLDYSGTLLHGLERMGRRDVIESLRGITCDPALRGAVEWLGCPWGHAVAPSTPVPDYPLHVCAWQQHFAALFGFEALARVRGFSPAELALPNHPDVAWAFVRTLRDAGYDWVLVQEHTIEQPGSGAAPGRPHLPHRLVCTGSRGETASIVAVIKTQGSDGKLVGQMQPYGEARGLERSDLAGRPVPPLVFQIGDGENGGVMMHEFPRAYESAVRAASGSPTPLVTVAEYLGHLHALGIAEDDLPVVQPVLQHRIWARMQPGDGPQRLACVLDELRREDGRFHVEGGSWTGSVSWVRGYESVLGAMREASDLFHQRVAAVGATPAEARYRRTLFHLLASQTSCFRYWGEGRWTDFGRELCRRTREILRRDFAA